jgi:phosphopantothenoylcysteine synthetase/decarboxylase
MDVIVTCGATRNPVDAMRYMSARSTGQTGLMVARALKSRGHRVHVLGSAEAALRAPDLQVEEYGSTRDLFEKMQRAVRLARHGALVHSAAVGDYEVAAPNAGKTPSGQAEWLLRLTPTPKIADHVREWGLTGPYVTFKAAAPDTSLEDLQRIASAQRKRTGSDRVFANVLGKLGTVLWVGDDAIRFDDRLDAVRRLIAYVAGEAS